MTKIGILSDTHGFLDESVMNALKNCDEIWHAGDIGSEEVYNQLKDFKPLRAVYGNMDGGALRYIELRQFNFFQCEQVSVLLTHIGGYPKRYAFEARQEILKYKPQLFVCGHSHILKVQYDKDFNMLCVNPGASGISGQHMVRTIIRLEIDGTNIQNLEVVEFPKHVN